MKKLISLFLIICMLLLLPSCSMLFKPNNTSLNNRETASSGEYTVITIKGGESNYTCQVQVGEKGKIELPVKNNFVCTGIFSEEEGGTKYFDEDGEATMVWQSNFPDILYAQFKNIVGMQHIYERDWDEDPHYISFYESYFFTFTLSDDFINALESNGSLDVEIQIYYDMVGVTREYNGITSYISSTKDSEGCIKTDNYDANYQSFTTRTLVATCKAKQLLKNDCVYFKLGSRQGYEDTRVKNVYCIVTILGVN